MLSLLSFEKSPNCGTQNMPNKVPKIEQNNEDNFDNSFLHDMSDITDLTNSLAKGVNETAQTFLSRIACQDFTKTLQQDLFPERVNCEPSSAQFFDNSLSENNGQFLRNQTNESQNQSKSLDCSTDFNDSVHINANEFSNMNGQFFSSNYSEPFTVYGKAMLIEGKLSLQLQLVDSSNNCISNTFCWLCGEHNSPNLSVFHKHSLRGVFAVNGDCVQMDIDNFIIPDVLNDSKQITEQSDLNFYSGEVYDDKSSIMPNFNSKDSHFDNTKLSENYCGNSEICINQNYEYMPKIPIMNNCLNANSSKETQMINTHQIEASVSTSSQQCNLMSYSHDANRKIPVIKNKIINSQLNETGKNCSINHQSTSVQPIVKDPSCSINKMQESTTLQQTFQTKKKRESGASKRKGEVHRLITKPSENFSYSDKMFLNNLQPESELSNLNHAKKTNFSKIVQNNEDNNYLQTASSINVQNQQSASSSSTQNISKSSENKFLDLGPHACTYKNDIPDVDSNTMPKTKQNLIENNSKSIPKKVLKLRKKNTEEVINSLNMKNKQKAQNQTNSQSIEKVGLNSENSHKNKVSRKSQENEDKLESIFVIQCPFCELKFSSKCIKKFGTHLKAHGLDFFLYRCPVCMLKILSSEKYIKHLNMHREIKFLCKQCSATFNRGAKLRRHVDGVHKSNRPYACDICLKRFSRVEYLKTHKNIHEGRKFKCNVCSKEFSTPFNLKVHFSIHSNDKKFHCQFCDRAFVRRDFLNQHISKDHQNKKFKCDTCGKLYSRRDILLRHKKTHSLNKTSFLCNECGLSFSRSDTLKAHKCSNRMSVKEKYLTEIEKKNGKSRNMVFSGKEKMDEKVNKSKIVSAKFSFCCKICNTSYNKESILQRHMNKSHPELSEDSGYNYQPKTDQFCVCPICSTTFTRSCYLKLHMKNHMLTEKSMKHIENSTYNVEIPEVSTYKNIQLHMTEQDSGGLTKNISNTISENNFVDIPMNLSITNN